MYLFPCVTQAACQHQFHLRVDVFHALFNYKPATVGNGIDIFQFGKQDRQFLFGKQPDAFQHGDVSHRAEHVVLGEIEIHLTVFAYRKGIHFLVYLNILFPKFLSHQKNI